MRRYHQLSQQERYTICALLISRKSEAEIARQMSRNPSTIGRELARNRCHSDSAYRSEIANSYAVARRRRERRGFHHTAEQWQQVIILLKEKWSPEQISGRLKRLKKSSVSHETIYRFLLTDKANGGELYKHLRHQAKPYRKRYGKNDYRGTIPGRIDIDERPAIVDEKTRLGDWEADTVIGKGHQGVLVTLTERVSKLNLVIPIARKEAVLTKDAIIQALMPFAKWVHTITFDNGREFCRHIDIATALACDTYFAKPYHSWERGLNENHNGLLRQYFPKNQPLNNINQDDANKALAGINHRPRKKLNYKTPWEVFCEMASLNIDDSLGVTFMS